METEGKRKRPSRRIRRQLKRGAEKANKQEAQSGIKREAARKGETTRKKARLTHDVGAQVQSVRVRMEKELGHRAWKIKTAGTIGGSVTVEPQDQECLWPRRGTESWLNDQVIDAA